MATAFPRMLAGLVILILIMTGVPLTPAEAQLFGPPRGERQEQPPPRQRVQQRSAQQPPPQEARRPNFFERLFGTRRSEEPPGARPGQQFRGTVPRSATPRPNRTNRTDSAAPAAAAKRKVEPTTFVAVLGDSLARDLAKGLDQALEERPEVGLVREIRPGVGFLKETDRSWKAIADDVLNRTPPMAAAVVFMGPHDDPPVKGKAEQPADSGISPWTDLYAARVDDITLAFRLKGIPLLWVGLPPVADARVNADNAFLNELVQQRVTSLGATFIDVWEGFVDEDEAFTAQGPNLGGQIVRLRTADGVHFTEEGAGKLAHYVELELRNYLISKDDGTALADVAKEIEAVPITPGSSRILLLGEAPRTPGAQLVPASAPANVQLAPETQIAARALTTGEAIASKPGRADDFTWNSFATP
ncbi:SGNH/GDSL hydrolase family protein [Terrihabitans sp. B22-R8]|uniref:SGNH/GDSL hydrolase family protein n=1 Tax=Terrihabitans sp. B22-R8 TaxID=3425128 RepID=UPI00403C5B90